MGGGDPSLAPFPALKVLGAKKFTAEKYRIGCCRAANTAVGASLVTSEATITIQDWPSSRGLRGLWGLYGNFMTGLVTFR